MAASSGSVFTVGEAGEMGGMEEIGEVVSGSGGFWLPEHPEIISKQSKMADRRKFLSIFAVLSTILLYNCGNSFH